MAAPQTMPDPHIVRNPDILGGEPTIAGTRIAARTLVVAARYTPTAVKLLEAFPHLTPEEIEEASAFYRDHREEIDRYIAENDAALVSDDW